MCTVCLSTDSVTRYRLVRKEALNRKMRAHRDLPTPDLRRAIRVSAGLSQQDMAEVLRVTREAVSRWETGDRRPRGARLIAYGELLQALDERSV